MKYLKINLLILSLVFFALTAKAQSSLTIDASQMISTFKFVNSESNKMNSEYESILTGSYGVGYRYVLNGNIIVRGGLGMRNSGANLVYDEMNYSWHLQYLEVKAGGGYLYNMGKFSPYLALSFYYANLRKGIQVLNNEEFNITESGLLNKSDIGLILNPGVNFELSDYISSYLEFNYTMGLNNIETDDSQQASNRAYGLTLGLAFTIK